MGAGYTKNAKKKTKASFTLFLKHELPNAVL